MNRYCDKFSIGEHFINDNINNIRYIHAKDLMTDTGCEKVCDMTQIRTCKVLEAFASLKKPAVKRFVRPTETPEEDKIYETPKDFKKRVNKR